MAEGLLRGKVAIVTGAGSPIGTGHAMAIGLVRAGARVALLDLNQEWLARSLDEIEAIGGSGCAVAMVTDVSDPDAVERAVRRTIAELGGLHILVNNAGTTARAAGFSTGSRNFWDIPVAAWDRVIAVNLSGAFYTARAVAGHLLVQRWGRIIGVTTSVDTMYRQRTAPYGPSKAGHEALIALMSRELEGTGVTANVLVPGGPTNTNFFAAKTDVDRAALIQPEVMQAPVVWLASDSSQACNGRRIVAHHWDERLPLAERLAKASAPAAWPQLGKQAITPGS
jgi:NAD(P)-dependent dehydrogenase (short-subunit alcohol dehydrogenase family)